MSAAGLLKAGAPPLVLASGSATRAALLRAAGIPFEVVRPVVDEAAMREAFLAEQMTAEEAATALAEIKAERAATASPEDAIVLGADQILELDGDWFEKPPSIEAAARQLRHLRGRRHRLVSAAVVFRGGVRVWHAVDEARLTMRPFSDAFLERYLELAGLDVLSSVGCYRLEGLGVQLMAEVRGAHSTILGLPLLPLLQFLRDQGVLES
jgi:septum formation protein